MSIVIGYASEDFSFIMSDGKAMGDRATEMYDKTFKLGNHTIGGYVGFAEEVDQILNVIRQEYYGNTEEVVNDMEELFDLKPPHIIFDSDFTMIGRDDNGILCKYLIGKSSNYKCQKKTVSHKDGEFHYIGGTVSREEIARTINKYCKNRTLDALKKAQMIITDVAKIDPSVNDNYFYQILD